jgi:hypothetical protein
VLQVRELRCQRLRERGVVAAAEPVGHEQDARAGLGEHEPELALAEHRHQRHADRPDAQRRERHRQELQAVRQLVCDGLARLHTECEQPAGDHL